MKKITIVFLAAALLLAAGCKKDGASVSTAGTKKPISFTFYTVDSVEDMPFTDPVAKKITEATGVTLLVDHPVGGDQQAIPLMIASGQYPDLIYAKGNLNLLIEAGAVIPLDDLIEKNGKHIKELYGDQMVRLRNSSDDPHIYTVGTYSVKTAYWRTDGTMQLQHAVLKELGYPRMQTLDDYEKAVKAYIQKYPTINGQKTIGLSLLIDTWQWYIDLSNPSNALIGFPDDGQWIVDQNTLEVQYKFLHPDAKLFYKWLNRMNAEGILDPESFTQKEDIWKAKIAAGRVLGLAYPLWGYGEARSSLIKDGMADRTYAYLPIMADGRYKCVALKDYGFSGGWGIAISSSCKDPERAFEFLDWMCSEEAQILVNWGIEGINYRIVDGKRIVPDEEQRMAETDPDYGRKTGVGRWAYPFPMRGPAYIDSTGNYITKDSPERIRNQEYLDVEKETLAAYGAEMWTDLFPSTESLGVSKHGAAWQYTLPPDANAKLTEADNYMKNALANLVLGKPANFEDSWQKIVQDLRRMGIEDAGKILTNMVKDKIKLWSK
ncbi:MAG: ABC transporter substrate-binding protein [Spirochaetaceae bacterium]|jgi:putative aldouronate transport system substrate-binding protein|nr:ABC transporter substrate-binding protein [Spirochaetaceae bacterium]